MNYQLEQQGKKTKTSSPSKAKPKQSMDAGDYKPELLTGFSHTLLKTYSLVEIFHTLDLGDDFPFIDFFRAVLFPDADFKPVQDQTPIIWMSLK